MVEEMVTEDRRGDGYAYSVEAPLSLFASIVGERTHVPGNLGVISSRRSGFGITAEIPTTLTTGHGIEYIILSLQVCTYTGSVSWVLTFESGNEAGQER